MAKIRKATSSRKSRRKSVKKNRKSFIKYYKTLCLFKRNRKDIKNNWSVCKTNNSYLKNKFYEINNFEKNGITNIINTPSTVFKEKDNGIELQDNGIELQYSSSMTSSLTLSPQLEFAPAEAAALTSPPSPSLLQWDWRNPKAPEKWKNTILEKGKGAKPYLGRNDLDLLFNYLLVESPCNKLRLLWNKAAALNQTEEFLCAFAKVLSRKKISDGKENDEIENNSNKSYEKVKRLRIVRTHENGNKYVTSLENGFITTVFDVEI